MKQVKLCECGCGEATSIAKQNQKEYGYVKGQPRRYISGHNPLKGRKQSLEERIKRSVIRTGHPPIISPFLPNNVFLNKHNGRWNVKKRKAHARAVYEYFKGEIPKGYDIHHINGDPSLIENDHPDNLLAVPHVWNFIYFTALSKGFNVHESIVTAAYIKVIGLVPEEDLFTAVCKELVGEK